MNSRLRAEGSSRIAVSSRFSGIPLLATGYGSIVGSFGLCSQLIVVNAAIAVCYSRHEGGIGRQQGIANKARARRAASPPPCRRGLSPAAGCPILRRAGMSLARQRFCVLSTDSSTEFVDESARVDAIRPKKYGVAAVRKSPDLSRRVRRLFMCIFPPGIAPLQRRPFDGCARPAGEWLARRTAHKTVALCAAAYTQDTPYFRRKPSGARSWARKGMEPRKRKNRRY